MIEVILYYTDSMYILQPTSDKEHIPHVPSVGERRVWRSVCVSGAGHRQDVCLQEAGEEAYQKKKRRSHGPQ